MMVNHDIVTIINWMDAIRGDPRLDVCHTYLLYSKVSVDAAEIHLKEYCRQSGLERDEVLRWLPVVAGARLSETIGIQVMNRLARMVDGA